MVGAKSVGRDQEEMSGWFLITRFFLTTGNEEKANDAQRHDDRQVAMTTMIHARKYSEPLLFWACFEGGRLRPFGG